MRGLKELERPLFVRKDARRSKDISGAWAIPSRLVLRDRFQGEPARHVGLIKHHPTGLHYLSSELPLSRLRL
jgi:hypothetical protein